MVTLTAASQALLDKAQKKQATANTNDGKIYNTGKTGKNYVYNPSTGNIMVDGRVVNTTSDAYAKTLATMQKDTGKTYNQYDSSMPGGGVGVGGTVSGNFKTFDNNVDTYYKDAQAQAIAANNAAIQKQVNALQSQLPTVQQSYENVYKQIYANQMNAQKNLPQLLAAQGFSGGETESSLIGKQNEYANLLNQAKLSEKNDLADIQTQINNARLTGAVNEGSIASDYAGQTANAYLQLLQQQQERDYNAALLADERKYSEGLTEKERQAAIYQQLLGMGVVTPEVANYYGTTVAQLKNSLASGTTATKKSGSTGGGGSNNNTSTEQRRLAALKETAATKFGGIPTTQNISGQYNAIDYLLKNAASVEEAANLAKNIGIEQNIINAWLKIRGQVEIGEQATGYR